MAQLISIKLSRFDATPWGFRLQGGKDFGGPLQIQKVNGGSPAEKAGLQAGDAVIRVNDVEVFHLRHKEAQDYIVKAGNNFEFTVERGGVSTWKPQVTPVGPAPVNYSPVPNVKPVTKTSLASKKQDVPPVGSGHNFAPRPYAGPQVNGISDSTVKSIVNKQYNTPVGIYSEETIAETLSAQAEVLAGGVLGVNFKKNEKIYNAANSEVLKMVQEIDSEPKEPEPEPSVGGPVTSPSATGLRHVVAPETKPTPTTPHDDPFKVLPPGQNICADCERLIVGVFVRIKDKNLHVECFKCATCGTSLKNVGYYNINNKLYCDIHAKMVARQNPPAPNLEPVTIPPGSQVPAGTISAALARAPVGPASNYTTAPSRAPASTYAPVPAPLSPGNLSPQPGTLGPLPFHAPRGGTTHVSAPRPVQAPSSLTGPKPYSTLSAPVTNPARPTPAGSIFVWPPSTSEEATCPTATPLYVPTNPCQQASNSILPTDKAPPRIPLASVKSAPPAASASASVLTSSSQDHAATCVSPPTSTLTVAPECPYPPFSGSAVAPTPFQVTPTGSTQQTAPFPQPFSAYVAKHHMPLREVPSLAPIQQGHSQHLEELPPVQTVLQSLTHETNAMSVEDSQAEDLQALKNAGLQKKFSLCSQEVFTINVDKPAPKFEALSETLETQIVGSSLTPGSVKRPGSPVPMQDSKTSSLQELDFAMVQETSRQAASEQDAQAEAIVNEISVPEAPNPVTESVPSRTESTRPTGITNIETRQVSCTSESQDISVTEQSVLSQQSSVQVSEVRSSNQITIETQEVQSQFVSEVTASNGPCVPSPVSAVCSQSEGISKSGGNMLSQSETISSEAVSGFVPVSREQEYCATQFQQQTRHLSSQQSSSVISESAQSLETFVNDQPTSQMLPSQAQDPTIANPSSLLSALTPSPDCTSSPLPRVAEPVVPVPTQAARTSIQAAYSAAMKPMASAPLPVSVIAPHSQEVACSSPLLSALTVASDRPYSPLPSATKPMAHFPVQSSPVSTQAIKPAVPAPLPAGIQAPLARGAAYPSVMKPAPLPASSQVPQLSTSAPVLLPNNTEAPLNPEDACPSPLTLALTIAPDRPYSPLSSSTRSLGFMPVQTAASPAPATAPASTKFLPSEVKAPFKELPLRDETQLPLILASSQQITAISEPQHIPTRDTPIRRPVSVGPLPVIGAFRPIIPQTQFKPISSSLVSDKEPHLPFPPVSEEFKTESLVSAPARPKTPVQRVATPTSCSRSGTPFQQRKCTTTGLQKPAIIPLYQQQMGDSPGQRPRSATPTCPMTVPRTQTPQSHDTKTEVPYAPQTPSASFQRQPPPQKPYASYQPVARDAPPTVVQSEMSAQQPCVPFPNIPLPEDFKSESQALPFRPVTFSSTQPCFTPQQEPLGLSPQSPPLPATSDPIVQFLPLAAPQPTAPALVAKRSLLAGSQSVSVAPEPFIYTTVPVVPVSATQPISVAKTPSAPSSSSVPNAGGSGVGVPGGSQRGASFAGSTAPRRGRGVLTQQTAIAGGRIALCAHCKSQIRGPFITALGKNWCPDHFVCVNAQCRRPLADIGFVEEKGELYCEYCFEKYLAPTCDKCSTKIKGDCLNAIGKHFHPECFLCAYCGKLFGNNPFFLEDGLPYCEDDWNELFTTKCFACGFPIEAGDRWVEALSNNYHSQCFNCTNCKKNLEGQSFYAKGGRPFCKAHAR